MRSTGKLTSLWTTSRRGGLKTIPQKGDGLLLIKAKDDYGFEISQNPLLTTFNHYKKGRNKEIKDINRKDRVLIIKKVKQNKKHHFNLND